jgi:hypothetical protein
VVSWPKIETLAEFGSFTGAVVKFLLAKSGDFGRFMPNMSGNTAIVFVIVLMLDSC